ncbi:hypothetical protein [Streptococcus plurextorum]|uniref:hypothetical protein n=1 Tax=Streptococcus plurextorum TaxID=456876 RepID=UPI000402A4BA|nr:hypothetical protein [Streptococcus plurextorum]
MNHTFEMMDKTFTTLSEVELIDVTGGEWPGEGLVRAVFDIGRQTGRAIRSWFR